MILALYSLLFTILLPLAFVRLWVKGKKNQGYRQHWGERLGHLPFRLNESIWLHAVSLGEMVAAAPLIQNLLETYPSQKLTLTCMTPTGRAEAEKWTKKFPERVYVAYLPYDAPFCVKRAIARINPKILIVMETELWPNLFRLVKKPIIVANARISDKAFPKYQKIQKLMQLILKYVSHVAAQSEEDAKRFRFLGATQVSVMGNIKYDLADPLEAIAQAEEIHKTWQPRLIFTAASTHEGEETLLISAYENLKTQFKDLLLILIPRHPERFDRVEELCKQNGLTCLRRTANQAITHEEDVLLVDKMGEVKTFYALSDLTFVGGSLIPIGGHNILESAILGKPILVGPYMQNARAVVNEFLASEAIIQLENPAKLTETLQNLLQDTDLCNKLGQNALTMMQKNRGALAKLMQVIGSYV